MADLRRIKMGFVFQQPNMLKNLNILDYIVLPSMRDNRKKGSKILVKAKMLMGKVGITELENRDITQVSGGQLQRAGICRALINSPKIVFGDEPTGALNSKTSQEIMEIFLKLN
jgi:putative ABC transport system ATP-binding protein